MKRHATEAGNVCPPLEIRKSKSLRSRAVLLYDGACRFCTLWAARWKQAARGNVDFLSSQEAAWQFPEIPAPDFEKSIQWIGTDGQRRQGADAALHAMAAGGGIGRVFLALYQRFGFLQKLTESAYGFVARHRYLFSRFTRLIWGNSVERPQYAKSAWWFLRLFGVVYLSAFVSLWVQVSGLIGTKGILPAADFFEAVRQSGPGWFFQTPSLCAWASGDVALQVWCGLGVALSICLMAGLVPRLACIGLWALYLSVTVAGQEFFYFQWDALLIEAGFLAIFLAPWGRLTPWGWRPGRVAPSRVARCLLIWLLFRFMFSSGVVKLSSGDSNWRDLLALQYHYFTQPLPNPVAWYMQQLPLFIQKASAVCMFAVELILPFFVFLPRNGRLLAFAGFVLLQIAVALTGNYGFFNLLTIVLCVLLLDDQMFAGSRAPGSVLESVHVEPAVSPNRRHLWIAVPGWVGAVFLVLVSLVPLAGAFRWMPSFLQPLVPAYAKLQPFRLVNGYGLFAVMTTERREILVQGSDDGLNWKTYEFRYKPGPLDRMPPQVAPHMPRLDWQMWFAALGNARQNPWFLAFVTRLLEGSDSVEALLKTNPFPDHPPRYIRALTDDYRFTTFEQQKVTGDWWQREPLGIYLQEVRLR